MVRSCSVDVYLVWHVRHAAFLDGQPTRHRDDSGQLSWDEEDGDDVKLLGVFESPEAAQARIDRARQQPGFNDEPDCFMVDPYTVGEDTWSDGFVSIPRG